MERRIRRLEDLAALIPGGRTTAEPGEWYLVENRSVLLADGTPFSRKAGGRPCIVVRPWDGSEGDVCRVLPRSASSTSGLAHDPHGGRCDPRPSCKVTKRGRVVTAAPAYVTREGMAAAVSSCDEPDGPLRVLLIGAD